MNQGTTQPAFEQKAAMKENMSHIRRTYIRTVTHEIIRSEPSGSIPLGRCPLCGHETVAALPETGTQTLPADEKNLANGSSTQRTQTKPPPSE